MAKVSGLGWTTASVDNSAGSLTALKNDFTNLQFSTPVAIQDVTGIDKSAIERLPLLADFSITLNGVFDTTAHAVFKDHQAQATAVRTITLVVASQTLTNETILTDYALTRAAGGDFTFSVPAVLADGTVPAWT